MLTTKFGIACEYGVAVEGEVFRGANETLYVAAHWSDAWSQATTFANVEASRVLILNGSGADPEHGVLITDEKNRPVAYHAS